MAIVITLGIHGRVGVGKSAPPLGWRDQVPAPETAPSGGPYTGIAVILTAELGLWPSRAPMAGLAHPALGAFKGGLIPVQPERIKSKGCTLLLTGSPGFGYRGAEPSGEKSWEFRSVSRSVSEAT